MKAPKILPWIARKTGISEELALKLWRRAAGESEVVSGCCNSSDYYRRAVERFIDLAELEGNCSVVRETVGSRSRMSWVWRHQDRISKLQLMTVYSLVHLWQTKLNSLVGNPRQAA
jgi:hypothetical protein